MIYHGLIYSNLMLCLKICSKFAGEHPCRSVISIKLQSNFIESHFDMGVHLQICCIFSEHLFLRATLSGCFWSRAWDNLGWAFGTSASIFSHIFLTLIDLLFDNLRTPSWIWTHYPGYKILQTPLACIFRMYNILWSWRSRVFWIELYIIWYWTCNILNCNQLLLPLPFTIALIALGKTLLFAEKTYCGVRCALITWFTATYFVFEPTLNFFFYVSATTYSGIIIRYLVIEPPQLS